MGGVEKTRRFSVAVLGDAVAQPVVSDHVLPAEVPVRRRPTLKEAGGRHTKCASQKFARTLGVSADTPLARMWRDLRTLRLADGPDEVHKTEIARRELKRFAS